jgi:gluconolactonase
MFDSMAVDGDGNICIATLGSGPLGMGGISVVTPQGELHSFVHTGDVLTTNIAFGGPDGRDALITASGSGRLLKMRWHCAGHRCHFEELLVAGNVAGGGSRGRSVL